MSEVADTVAAIRDRIDLPILVDADTGFGNALNVQRTVRAFERAGAAALQLEDQTLPKRCGHLDGKTLVSVSEMTGKIRAAMTGLFPGKDRQIILQLLDVNGNTSFAPAGQRVLVRNLTLK